MQAQEAKEAKSVDESPEGLTGRPNNTLQDRLNLLHLTEATSSEHLPPKPPSTLAATSSTPPTTSNNSATAHTASPAIPPRKAPTPNAPSPPLTSKSTAALSLPRAASSALAAVPERIPRTENDQSPVDVSNNASRDSCPNGSSATAAGTSSGLSTSSASLPVSPAVSLPLQPVASSAAPGSQASRSAATLSSPARSTALAPVSESAPSPEAARSSALATRGAPSALGQSRGAEGGVYMRYPQGQGFVAGGVLKPNTPALARVPQHTGRSTKPTILGGIGEGPVTAAVDGTGQTAAGGGGLDAIEEAAEDGGQAARTEKTEPAIVERQLKHYSSDEEEYDDCGSCGSAADRLLALEAESGSETAAADAQHMLIATSPGEVPQPAPHHTAE